MLKTTVLAVFAALAASASAQYVCTQPGTALNYTHHMAEGDHTTTSTDSIVANTEEGGKHTVTMKSYLHTEDAFADDVVLTSTASYTTADEPTEIVMLTADEFKTMIVGVFKKVLQDQGQYSESVMEEISNGFKAKGELTLTLNPKAAQDEKIAPSRLRLDMGMQAASMFISNGKVAGFETVECKAGKFENCIKVTYEERETSPEGSKKAFATAWYAPEVGLVKEIKADKKGNEIESQELVSISR